MKTTFSSLRPSLLCVLVALFVIQSQGSAEARKVPVAKGLSEYTPWSEEIIELFSKIPVQDDGRVKPLETVARFRLYHLSGRRSLEFEVDNGKETESFKIGSVAWYLDCLFRPEIAKTLPCLLVDHTVILTDIGLQPPGAEYGPAEQRARISFNYLAPTLPENSEDGVGALSAKREEYLEMARAVPKYVFPNRQQQLLNLHDRMAVMRYLVHMLDFTRGKVLPNASIGMISPELGDPEAKSTPLSGWLENWQKLPEAAMATGKFDRAATENLMRSVGGEIMQAAHIAGSNPDNPIAGIAIFTPEESYKKAWRSIGEEILAALESTEPSPKQVARVRFFEELSAYIDDQAEFQKILEPFVEERIADAKARGEYSKVPLELKYYDWGFLHRALPWFIIAFVLVALSWLAPGSQASRYLGWASVGTCGLALLYVIGAITIRCMIMSRAPIATLYETILFIVAFVVLLCLILEYFDRKKIALAVAAVLGAAGMFLAMVYEMKEAMEGKGDTMATLQAVLRSNFWLSTHVVIINIGYAAALLGAGLSAVYIVFRLTRGGALEDDVERSITRMVYGIICFGLIFSLVGTVLGGIWANDSWGRFWGWDPKENGALMIVLWSLVILHARLGGYIRNIGLHAASVMLGIITVFSWWGVNQLGVGLHSYGETSGVKRILNITYGIHGVFIVLAGVVWLMERANHQAKVEAQQRRGGKGPTQAEA